MQSEAPKTSDQLLKTVTEKADELINLLRYNSLGPEKILEFVCYDKVVRMHLPFAMQDRLQNLILRHLHFSEYLPLYAIRELITPGSVFVDAGANIGNHTLFFSLICEAAMVYAFEPMKEAFKTLQRNLSINGVTNVTAWNCGLGGAASAAKLKRYSHLNFGMASLDPNESGPYRIIALDTIGITSLHFFKIDVEGLQEEVLRGARETLARCKPMIWIELRTQGPFDEYDSGNALLRDLGYRQLKALTATDYLFAPV